MGTALQKPLSILVADDHGLVRDGLRIVLADLPGLHAIHEAGCADEVLAQLAACPDISLVILDLQMPGVRDLDLLTGLCNDHPDLPVVVLSASDDRRTIHRAIENGAAGFIPKHSARNVLLNALRLVLAGGVYIPTEMLTEDVVDVGYPGPVPGEGFTSRQQDVIRLLVDGHTNKSIARELGLSEHTVKIHLSAIFKALGVTNRTEAALACRELVRMQPE